MINETPYSNLTPEVILDAIEAQGFDVSGHLTALNSYENRVYMIGIEDQPDIIAKFYRPGRWTEHQIQEEHQFVFELFEDDIQVIEPIKIKDNSSLVKVDDYWLAIFPKRSGHPLELDNSSQLEQVGRTLGRLHAKGSTSDFQHRLSLNSNDFGWLAKKTVLESGFLPYELENAYESTASHLLEAIDNQLLAFPVNKQRIHGDFHPGNILYRDQDPWLVDFDDCITGPRIQDIWMLLSGDTQQQQEQLDKVLKGYNMFADLDPTELNLIEVCRSLRILHYAAWLARRWNDPAFPIAFPWFDTPRFWSDHILQLKEQLSVVRSNELKLRSAF